MSATLHRSGQFWRLEFLWADQYKSLSFETAKAARDWAKHWKFRIIRVANMDR